jgi:hypothetical protein
VTPKVERKDEPATEDLTGNTDAGADSTEDVDLDSDESSQK